MAVSQHLEHLDYTHPLTSKEASDAIETLTRYFEQNKHANEDDITNMNKFKTRVNTLSKMPVFRAQLLTILKNKFNVQTM